jgi:hypothetical protein
MVNGAIHGDLDCARWISTPGCRQPIELRPNDSGAAPLSAQEANDLFWQRGWIRPAKPPGAASLALIKVPRGARHGPLCQGDDGEPPTLRERRSFQAESKSPQVHSNPRLARVPTAKSHGGHKVPIRHPVTVVDDGNERLGVNRQPDRNLMSIGRDAVIDQVSKGGRRCVTDRPQRLHEKRRDRRQLDADRRAHVVHLDLPIRNPLFGEFRGASAAKSLH